jgi:hypothetical protein
LQPVWKRGKASSASAVPSVNSGKSSTPSSMLSQPDDAA